MCASADTRSASFFLGPFDPAHSRSPIGIVLTPPGPGRVSHLKPRLTGDLLPLDRKVGETSRQLRPAAAFGLAQPDRGWELFGCGDLDLVFSQPDGSTLSPNAFSQAFDRQVKGAGLPRIRLHDLRHTHATLALEAGIHPKVISERLGHSTVSITLDIYSHAIPALQETAAELVAALVLGAEADRGWPSEASLDKRLSVGDRTASV